MPLDRFDRFGVARLDALDRDGRDGIGDGGDGLHRYGDFRLVAGLVDRADDVGRVGVAREGEHFADRLTVQGHGCKVFIVHGNAFGHVVGLAVLHADDLRRGGVEDHAVGADIGDVSGVVLDADVDDELLHVLGGDVEVAAFRPVGEGADGGLVKKFVGLVIENGLDARGFVVRRELDVDVAVEEQAEGDLVQDSLEGAALVECDRAGRGGLVDLVVLGHDGGNDAGFRVPDVEGERAVCRLVRCRQRLRPFAVRRIGQAELPAVCRRNDEVGVDPVVGIDAVFAAVGEVFGDGGRDAGRLGERVVGRRFRVAVERESGEADRNVLADGHVLEGRDAVYKAERVALDHTDERRRTLDGGGVRAVVLFVADLEVGDGQVLGRDACRRVGGLRGELVVRCVLAVQLKARESDGFTDTDILIGVGSGAELSGQFVAVADFGRITGVRDCGSGCAVVDLRRRDGCADDRDFLRGDVGGDARGLCGEGVVLRRVAGEGETGEGDGFACADVLVVIGSCADLDGQAFTVEVLGRCTGARDRGSGRSVVDLCRRDGCADDRDFLRGDVGSDARGLCGEGVVLCRVARKGEAGEGDGLTRADVLIVIGSRADLDGQAFTVEVFRRCTGARDHGSGRAVVDLRRCDGCADDRDFLLGDVGSNACGLRGEGVVLRRVAGEGEAGEGNGLARADVLIVIGSRADLDGQVLAVEVLGRRTGARDRGSGRSVVDLGRRDGCADDRNFLCGDVGSDACRLRGEGVVFRRVAGEGETGEGDGFARADVLVVIGSRADLDGQAFAVEVLGRRSGARDRGSGRAVVDLCRRDGCADDRNFLRGDVGGDACGLCGEGVVLCRVAGEGEAGEGNGLACADVLVVIGSRADLDGQAFAVEVLGQCTGARDRGSGRAVVDLRRRDSCADDRNFFCGDVGGDACGLCGEGVVLRRVAGEGEAGEGDGLACADILVVERRFAGHDGHIVAVDRSADDPIRCEHCIGRAVVDLAVDGHAGNGDFLRVDLKGHRRGGCQKSVALGDRDADRVGSDVLRRGRGVGRVVRVCGLEFKRHCAVGIGVVGQIPDGFAVVGLAVVVLVVDDRRFLFDAQLDRQLCRSIVAVALDICFAQGVEGHADGVFACGEGTEIAVVQLDIAIRVARVVVVVAQLLRPVIHRRNSVAVQIHHEARFRTAAHDVGHGAAAHLRVGVEHDALRADDLHVAALVGHADIEEDLAVRLDGEGGVLRRKRRPVAGDGVGACKGSFGEQIFDRLHAAARVARVHGDGLRRLKEQGEGVAAREGIECARADGKLRRGRGDVRHAEDRHMELAFDEFIGVAAAARMHRSAVHVDHKVCGLGIALGDLHREGVVLTVLCNGIAGDGVALAARQGDPIGHHDGDGNAYGVARDVRGGDDVRLVVRLDQEGVERGGDDAAVDHYGELVLVTDRELDAAVVDAAVSNAGDDRSGRVGRGDIAAAAELFMRRGVPHTVVRMRNDGDV